MIVKVFQKNKNGKIEFTKEELENLLNEIYWEGYNANTNTWIYKTPTYRGYSISTTSAPKPYFTCDSNTCDNTLLLNKDNKNEI